MSRRRSIVAIAVAAVLANAAAAAAARSFTPRPGTPDLASMAVQPSDLAPGAVIAHQGYSRPPKGFRAQYERGYRVAQAPAGGAPFALDSELVLAPTDALAARTVQLERALYASRPGRGLLAAVLLAAMGRPRSAQGDVHVGRPVALGVGAASFAVPAWLRVGRLVASAYFVELDDGPVAATLTFTAVGASLAPAAVSQLAAVVAGHVERVLGQAPTPGATGATGTTGATAATGATGATADTGGVAAP